MAECTHCYLSASSQLQCGHTDRTTDRLTAETACHGLGAVSAVTAVWVVVVVAAGIWAVVVVTTVIQMVVVIAADVWTKVVAVCTLCYTK